MPPLPRRRVVPLVLALLCLLLGPATARPAIMPVRSLQAGMKGYGLTVFHGTTVEKFPITILGVVRNYIAESDLILIRVDGGYPASHGVGIIAGMSGSPIYVGGRLVGALAYGWPFSKEPIGGVTPIESMLKELPGKSAARVGPAALSPGPRALSSPIRSGDRRLTRVQVVPTSAAARTLSAGPETLVLSPVPSLFQVSGFGERAYSGLEKVLRPLNMEPVRTFASAPPVHARIPRMTPGAAVGVQLLTGDLDISGTGTLTWLDGNRFLAFGHPMAQLGDVDLPMTAAYIQGVLPSYQRPFKFASQLGAIGSLTSDRLWAVGGTFGLKAPMIPVTIHLAEPSRHLDKTYHLRAIQHRFLTPPIITQAMMEGLSSLVPAGTESTAIVSYRIKPRGRPMLELQQMTSGAAVDASVGSQFNEYLAQLTNNDFAPLSLESVDVDVRLLTGKRTASIDKIYTGRNVYRRGEDIDLHVVLHPYGGRPFEKVIGVPVPDDMEKGNVTIGVSGGADVALLRKRLAQAPPQPTNIDQMLEMMVDQERGQQLIIKAAYPSKAAVMGEERFSFLPESLREVLPALPQSDVNQEKDVFERRLDTDWMVRGVEVINADVAAPAGGGDKKKSADEGGPPSWAASGGEAPQARTVGVRIEGPGGVAKTVTKTAAKVEKKSESTTSTTDKVLPSGTRRWDIHDVAAFAQGTFDGASLSIDGNVGRAPHETPLLQAGGDILWSLARDPRDGTVLVGTAPQGRVLRLVPTPAAATGPDTWSVKSAWKVPEAAVTALAVGSDGTAWIGTGPHGRLYRKGAADEGPVLVHGGDASYVWALLPQSDGSVLVGTGNPGRLLRVGSDGKTRVMATFSERHVRALARTAAGDLLVGTANPGVVYRISESQREVLLTPAFASVDALLARPGGEIVVASGKVVYRLAAGQKPRMIAVSDKPVLALAEAPDGHVAAASASGGVYDIDPAGETTRIAGFDGGPVLALIAGRDGLLAASAAPGRLVRLGGEPDLQGLWTSEVLDAGSGARWGRVRWMTFGSGGVSLQTRSGDTPRPDASWSAWSADCVSADGTPIASPPGRYLQVRARIGGEARLSEISVFFRNDEVQPTLHIVRPYGGERLAGTQKIEWKAVGTGVEAMAYDLECSTDGRTWKKIETGVGPAVKEKAVSATRGAADSEQTEAFSWDTRKVGDGVYRIRIEAYDAEKSAPRTTVLSKPFVVANTPPDLDSFSSEALPDGRVRYHGLARSHLAAIVSVAFKHDGGDWRIATPDDGVYDSDREPFSFVVSGGGRVEIRVSDEAGNSRTLKK